eukprot:CAMPEP_0194218766 /NCGR_PEP_ID=MMETSP0156-20130528/24513_1 /TAXON_ID=33649 /ORGANISM="Thalassionema nitzschioides, Strain L26-B" /LENGTH=197 /DNA_ID=CAMNT_0038948233 /DNA_START=51 /DNA_END=644 /DNA_ORIENTATION=+
MTGSDAAETFSGVIKIILEESKRHSKDDKIEALKKICDIDNDDELDKSVDKLITEMQKKRTMRRSIVAKECFINKDVTNLKSFVEWHVGRLPSQKTRKLEFSKDIWEDFLYKYNKEKELTSRMKFWSIGIFTILITGIIVGPVVLDAKLNSKTKAIMDSVCQSNTSRKITVDCDVIACSCCYDIYDDSRRCDDTDDY